MLTFPGVEVIAQIYESANSLVYRALRKPDNHPVILKVLKENYSTPQELARYRTEYKLTKSLNLPGCIHADSLEPYQNTLVMSVEDFGGESLKMWMQEKRFSLEEFLEIAIATADSLGQIHSANIIHKDINPSNIVYNSTTGQLKIIDFGISTDLKGENTPLQNPNILEGTLPYMSPEQTGRMNRTLDYRTDFYSLGITFYELLTGKLPFNTTDALELVHCHIAKQPISPQELDSNIPKPLSDIVMKLMEKIAEDRYQSAWGIQADLVCCLMQLEANGEIEEIVPGERDICERLQIPEKLYGREVEIATLLAAFERVSQQSELMLISGYSGIGKTALVQELYKPLTLKGGYFISGKFDQNQRNIPYSALVNAFQELVKQLLCESEAELQVWQKKLLEALGNNGQVIIEVIPEVEFLIGPQPAVIAVEAIEAQNRFNLVFQSFIQVFANSNHPLVIFLDDLQWSDGASFTLLQLLMSSPNPGLFLIGAYRENEVSTVHPLRLTVEEIARSGAQISRISLSPLTLGTVTQILADTLHCRPNQVEPLAEIICLKTGSNPFFIKEFIKSLYACEFLKFDNISLTWDWNLEEIQAQEFTDNVVELMAMKIQDLPEKTRKVLKIAACLGNQFELEMLSSLVEKSISETADALYPAVIENLVVPLGNLGDIELAIAGKLPRSNPLKYKFVYDHIQQAAYSFNTYSAMLTPNRRSISSLDMATIMKASEAISGEIVFHKLGSKLMNILRENIGAQKGYLILENQGKLVIEAEGVEGDEERTAIQSHPLQRFRKLPESIVSYVARTRETVVLDDAAQKGAFTHDPYIQKYQTKSILCAALTNQGKLTAIVYLENGLTSHAFTPDRLEVLQLLSGQAAIAIANAKLYAEVKERESRLTQFIDAMPIGVTVIDTTGQVTYANPTSQKLSGFESIADLNYQEFIRLSQPYLAGTNQLYPLEQMPIVRSLAGEVVTVEDMELHHSNQVISIAVSSTPIVDKKTGQINYAVATFQDISQRKQAEKLLADYNRTLEQQVSDRTQELQQEIIERQRAEEAAQAANRAKSIFLSNMSHELRTPLNVILGFSQLINRSSTLSSEHQESLGIITRSGEHLLNLINQVLDLSKIEAGRATLQETNFNLHRLLDDLEEMFQFQADSKRLQLLVERTVEVPEYVRTDEVKLRQVLINLINNALKFTQEGGVSVRVRIAPSSEWGGENSILSPYSESSSEPLWIDFEIEDTGDGIAAEEVTLLFQPFIQTQTGQNSQQGTGLGLTIAHSFVQLMGGQMTVSSQVGCGTVFNFNIRVYPVQSADRPSEPSSRGAVSLEPNQPTYRLLIVDDRWDNRQLLLRLLSPFGFELYEAENGRKALEIWKQYSPHLIFMDMRMPVMDGYETTQRIKATTQGQETVVIAITASTFEEEKAMVISMGCDDFIRKPFRPSHVFDILQKHIGVKFIFEPLHPDSQFPKLDLNALTPEALAQLPDSLAIQLQTAIINLDGEQMQTLTEQIIQHNLPLGNAIAFHLKQFQYELLLDLISNINSDS